MLVAFSLWALTNIFLPQEGRPAPEVVFDIPYKEIDGETLVLDVFMPQNVSEPTPAVIYVHGGGWFLRDRTDFYSTAFGLGVQGFAGVPIHFRQLPPNGWYDQVEDIKDAIRWIRANASRFNIDPDRIGISGASSGAHLAAVAATTGNGEGLGDDPPGASSAVQSGVFFEGIYNLVQPEHPKLTQALFWFFTGGPLIRDTPGEFAKFSPLLRIDGSEPPCMMIYGTEDEVVPEGQPQNFAKALRLRGVPAVAVPFPGKHGFNQFSPQTKPAQVFLALMWFRNTL